MEIKRKLPDREFVASYFWVAMPLILQSILMASVKLIDSLMVGSLGDNALAAVSSTGKIIFFVELLIWGPLGAVGIYTAQYFGSGNQDRLKQTFRFKLLFVSFIAIGGFTAFYFLSNTLTSIFLTNPIEIGLANDYMKIMALYFFGSAFSCAFGFTYREIGMIKMVIVAAISAVLVNTFLNWCLIYGNLGFDELGVKGAAIATVIAKFTELTILFVYTIYKKPLFYTKLRELFKIDRELINMMKGKLAFFTLNEVSYGAMSLIHYAAYASRSTETNNVLAAMAISDTLAQFMYATFQGVSVVIALYVGKLLGANELKKAEDNASKTIVTSLMLALVAGVFVIALSPIVIGLPFFAVEGSTRTLAQKFIILESIMFPLSMLGYNLFFIFRNGGDTKSVGFLDMYYIIFVSIPLALTLTYLTEFTAVEIRVTIIVFEFFKISYAVYRYKKKRWLKKLV